MKIKKENVQIMPEKPRLIIKSRYWEHLQYWLYESCPDIIISMDVGTALETIKRIKNCPEIRDDDYVSTLIEILEDQIEAHFET